MNSAIFPEEKTAIFIKNAIFTHHSQRPSQETKYPSLDKKSLNIDQKSNLSEANTLVFQELQKNEEKNDAQNLEDSIQMCALPIFEINNICDIYPETGTKEEAEEKSENSEEIAKKNYEEFSGFAGFREIEVNFQKGNKIGMGPHGKVYESLNLNSGEILAVKTINPEVIEEENAVFFQKNLLGFKHENVLFYQDFGYSNKKKRSFFHLFFLVFFLMFFLIFFDFFFIFFDFF